MGFVIVGFLGLALLFGAFWLGIYLATHHRETVRWTAEARRDEHERLLRTPDARLQCVACEHDFPGPLPEDGCPRCHSAAFVAARSPQNEVLSTKRRKAGRKIGI